jgi:hypothetical protein
VFCCLKHEVQEPLSCCCLLTVAVVCQKLRRSRGQDVLRVILECHTAGVRVSVFGRLPGATGSGGFSFSQSCLEPGVSKITRFTVASVCWQPITNRGTVLDRRNGAMCRGRFDIALVRDVGLCKFRLLSADLLVESSVKFMPRQNIGRSWCVIHASL